MPQGWTKAEEATGWTPVAAESYTPEAVYLKAKGIEPEQGQSMMERAAHPTTLKDLASLIAAPVDATRSVALSALTALPMRSITSGTLRGVGSVLESPITNVAISPKMGYLGRAANALADRIGSTPKLAGPTVQGVSLDELRSAGVGDSAINATMNGRTILPPKPRISAAEFTQLQQASPDMRAELLDALRQKIGR